MKYLPPLSPSSGAPWGHVVLGWAAVVFLVTWAVLVLVIVVSPVPPPPLVRTWTPLLQVCDDGVDAAARAEQVRQAAGWLHRELGAPVLTVEGPAPCGLAPSERPGVVYVHLAGPSTYQRGNAAELVTYGDPPFAGDLNLRPDRGHRTVRHELLHLWFGHTQRSDHLMSARPGVDVDGLRERLVLVEPL